MPETRELTAADILGADDIVRERVEVPEWGGHVYVRGLTGAERDAFEQSMIDRNTRGRGRNQPTQLKLDNVRAGLVARCAVSAAGERLFSDQQIVELGRKNAAALDRLYDVASRLSGLRDEDVEELVADFSGETAGPSTSPSLVS